MSKHKARIDFVDIFTRAWHLLLKRKDLMVPPLLAIVFALIFVVPFLFATGAYPVLGDLRVFYAEFEESYGGMDSLDYYVRGPQYDAALNAALEESGISQRIAALVTSANMGLFGAYMILVFLVGLLCMAALYLMVSFAVKRKHLDWRDAFMKAPSYALRIFGFILLRALLAMCIAFLIGISIVFLASTGVGIILIPVVILLAILLAVLLMAALFFGPAAIVYDNLSVMDAGAKSVDIAREYKWQIVVLVLILGFARSLMSYGSEPAFNSFVSILYPSFASVIVHIALLPVFLCVFAFVQAFYAALMFTAYEEMR